MLLAKYLLQLIPIDRDFDSPEVKRILQGYGLVEEAGRLAKIKQLANLPQDSGVAALCRLVRYEKSQVLSKQTALILLAQMGASLEERSSRAKIIGPAIARCSRPAARWLRASIQYDLNPEDAFNEWDKLIDEEVATLDSSPSDTSTDIVLTLERRQAELLLKLSHRDRAIQVMRKMIAIEKGDAQAIEQLTDWLIKQQALNMVDETAKRFDGAFHTKPVLLYFLAETRALQGQKDQAEELARQAAQLVPANDLAERYRVAAKLRQRGLFEWSEREYRRIADSAPDEPEGIAARVSCAEMLHDLEREHDAAEMLQKLIDSVAKSVAPGQRTQQVRGLDSDARSIKSWMHYYQACDYEQQKHLEKEWIELEKSIGQDPTNEDVLIAMYHASVNDKSRRMRVMEMIQKTAQPLINQISTLAGQPEEAVLCNQYAWLIGNTEGDIDQAIQYSHRSIELALQRYRGVDDSGDMNAWDDATTREPAGYIDTLAHCYAGKGDYENALKYQMRAAELEPHTMADCARG